MRSCVWARRAACVHCVLCEHSRCRQTRVLERAPLLSVGIGQLAERPKRDPEAHAMMQQPRPETGGRGLFVGRLWGCSVRSASVILDGGRGSKKRAQVWPFQARANDCITACLPPLPPDQFPLTRGPAAQHQLSSCISAPTACPSAAQSRTHLEPSPLLPSPRRLSHPQPPALQSVRDRSPPAVQSGACAGIPARPDERLSRSPAIENSQQRSATTATSAGLALSFDPLPRPPHIDERCPTRPERLNAVVQQPSHPSSRSPARAAGKSRSQP
jgi:hypothetical protein